MLVLLCDRAPALAARKAGRRGLLPQRQMELGQRIGGGGRSLMGLGSGWWDRVFVDSWVGMKHLLIRGSDFDILKL